MENQFTFLGTSHVVVLFLAVALTWGFVWAGRRDCGTRVALFLDRAPAVALLVSSAAYEMYRFHDGLWEIRYDLPMQLCTWASFAVVITAFTRNQFAFELSYYWILAGSIHGTLTPNLQFDFPHLYFFIYFVGHVSLIVALFYFLFVWKLRPAPGSVKRVFLFTQVYFATAMLTNLALDANYGYLMQKPENPSFLDYMGPWPRYLLEMQALAFFLFVLLYLPFRSRRFAMSSRKSFASVTDYIQNQSEAVRGALEKLRQCILKAVPEARELFNYGIPAFALKKDGKRDDQVMIAGYERHVGFYPHPSAIEHFKEELAGYKTGKGSVQFPLNQPIPEELVMRMVSYRKSLIDKP
ncbi:MAG: TIGR02206 family membrane protein [Leptospiraceae bacterium]|nr:TIGR02206 family membrane protein [Leptospiraceae bacterium]